ncbi:MAG: PAS domain S-box protein [bacterium]|nr:PAS domain S-box protein [bacterium]
MKLLNRLSIKNKLVAMILLVAISAMGTGFGFISHKSIKTFKNDMIANITLQAKLIGEYCVAPLTFNFKSDADKILQKLGTIPFIRHALVLDKKGDIFAKFGITTPNDIPEPGQNNPPLRFGDNHLYLFHVIVYHGKTYGTLYLKVSTDSLNKKIRDNLLTMVVLLAGLMLLSYLAAWKLQSFISEPILNLTSVSRKIYENKDYSLRVHKRGEDEIGTLYDEFNNMLDQMHLRQIERDNAEAELRCSKEALKESESKLKSILSSMVDLVLVFDKDGRFTFARTPAGAQSHPAGLFTGKKIAQVMEPNVSEQFEDGFKRIRKNEAADFEYSARGEDGTRWFSAKMSPMFSDGAFSGAVAVIRDITERKQIEEDLKKAENKYRTIFENATQGIFQVTPEGSLLTANNAFAKILGYDSVEQLKENVTNLDSRLYVDRDAREEMVRMLRSQGFVRGFEFRAYGKGLEIIYVSNNVHEVRDKDKQLLYYEGILEDITERKRAEKLKIEKDAAEAANLTKSEFLANMSHEIRTPMNAILGFTELLKEGILDKRRKEYLQAITIGGKTLLSLINDILDLSKIEAGKMDLQYAVVNPHSIFVEIKQIFSQKIKDKGLDFYMEIDPTLPEGLILDEIRLRQILFNLVGNAVKFTTEGYIKLSLNKYFTKTDHSSLDLIFSVEDTGIGIPEDQRELVFDAFKQQKGQCTTRYGGTGLGLSITKRLVEIMGGSISLESSPGEGSIFQAIFREVAVSAVARAKAPSTNRMDEVVFEKATILIVDDVESNRALLKGFLDMPAFTVVEAENGKEALALAKQYRPDLIIMDMRMPIMDGSKATRILKSHKQLKSIPVVVLTASAMIEQEKVMRKGGCDGFLKKPVNKNDFFDELMRFLPHSAAKMAVGTKENDAQETIDDVVPDHVKKSLPELITRLEAILTGSWKEMNKRFVIDEIEEFTEKVLDLGKTYALDILSRWAETLDDQVKSFDVEKMSVTLKEFPLLVTRLKNIAEKEE